VKNEMGGTCSAYWEHRVVYVLLVGKAEGKRALGRPSSKWDYYNKMKQQEVASDWMELAQYREWWRKLGMR